MKIRVTIDATVIEDRIHKFANRKCLYCNNDIFDIDNPSGICNGDGINK